MPYKRITDKRKADRKRYKRIKAEKHQELVAPPMPDNPGQAIEDWCRERLKVPFGHPNQGKPLILPDYGRAFIDDVFNDQYTEISLLISRKSAKTTLCSILVLSFIADDGPLRRLGWRCGVSSVSREKAGEMKRNAQAIAEMSGLTGIRFLRSPAPGKMESRWGEVEILSTETGATSSSLDRAVADELGLYPENARDMVATLRSSVSAKGGKFLSMSIVGDSPMTQEIIERQHIDKRLALHLYQAPEDCELDDPKAWAASSPAIAAGIKQLSYYESESARVKTTTKDIESFKSYDLNIRSTPGSETLVTLSSWNKCVVDDPPEPSGPCFIGVDIGGSVSMTCVSIFYVDTGRIETIGGFPRHPALKKRAEADNAPYLEMQRREELIISGDYSTDPSVLIAHVAERVKKYGCKVLGAAADLYRQTELVQSMVDCGVAWKMDWRRTGAGLHGHEDVRYFQKSVLNGSVVSAPSVLMVEAIKGSVVSYDSQRNPSIDKRKGNSRVDALSSAVLAVGGACRAAAKPRRKRQVVSVSLEELDAMSA